MLENTDSKSSITKIGSFISHKGKEAINIWTSKLKKGHTNVEEEKGVDIDNLLDIDDMSNESRNKFDQLK